jgi:hypothetical protein
MLPVLPFVLKLAIASAVFKRLWTTDAFVWFTFLKNDKEDFGVRMWQLSSLLSLGVFLLVEMSLVGSIVALLVSALTDTVVRRLSELNGLVHGMLDVESQG